MPSSWNSYRPDSNSDSRSVRPPRSPSSSDRQPSEVQSRDPRIRQTITTLQRNASTNLDGTNDKSDEHDIQKIIQEVGEAVYRHNCLKTELNSLQESLNRESQALDGAARLIIHKAYHEQLDQRREKLQLKVRSAKQKLEDSEKLVKTRIGKTTQMITLFASKASVTSDDVVADLRRQLIQKRRDRQSEVTSLQSSMQKQEQTMNKMRSELDILIKPSRVAPSVEISATAKKEQDTLNKKIDDIMERTQRHQTELLDFGKTLTNVTGDVESLKTQVSKQKLSFAKLDDVFTSKAEVESLTTRIQEVAKQASLFAPSEFIKQSQLDAYIQKFNDHEKDYANFRKMTDKALKRNVSDDYPPFKSSTEAVLQTLVTASKQAGGRISKNEAEVVSVNQRVGHDIKLLSDQLKTLKSKLDSTSKQVTGIEHSIVGLNSRYNNLSSDTLAKKMTAIVDARRTAVHDEVVKLSERVKSLQDDLTQVRATHKNFSQEEGPSDALRDLKFRHDKLEDRYTESQKDILQALTATSDQRNRLKKLEVNQNRLDQGSLKLQTKLETLVTTSEQSAELIKKFQHDHRHTSELLTNLNEKLTHGSTISTEMSDLIKEAKQSIEELQVRVSQLNDTVQKSRNEYNAGLTHVQEEMMSAIRTKTDDVRTGLKDSIDESRLLQKTAHTTLVANVAEARNQLDERLVEIEKAHNELLVQKQPPAKETSIEIATRTDILATRAKAVGITKSNTLLTTEEVLTSIVADATHRSPMAPPQRVVSSTADQEDSSDNTSGVAVHDQQEDISFDTLTVKRSSPVISEPPPKPDYYSRVKSKNLGHMDIVDLTSDDAILESSSQLLAKFGASSKNTKPPKATSPAKVNGSNNPSTPSTIKPSSTGSALKSARDTIEKMKRPKKRKRDKQEGTPIASGSASSDKTTQSSKKSRR